LAAILRVPANYYQQYDADIGTEHPGLGYRGWATRELELDLDKTALVSMHVWNPGLDDRVPFGPDSPFVGAYRAVEYCGRAMEVTQTVFPPLLAAARKAGLTVIHVGSDERYAGKYAEYRRIKELAGPEPAPPAGAVEDPVRLEWQQERTNVSRGMHNMASWGDLFHYIDFAPQAKPEPGEPVVITSRQLNAACRERGIWHLIYVGFAINVCLQSSPGGMVDMARLGYSCSTIRQATLATENKETCRDERAKDVTIWHVALHYGYVFDLDPFLAALNGLRRA